MIRKIFLLSTSYLLLQVVLVACCTNPIIIQSSSKIVGIDLLNFVNDTHVADTVELDQDDFYLVANFQIETTEEYVQQQVNSLVNIAMATQPCEEFEFLGLKNPIEEFDISCNQPIMNTEANANLPIDSFYLLVPNRSNIQKDSILTKVQLIDYLQDNLEFYTQSFKIKPVHPLPKNQYFAFTMNVHLKDSTILKSKSPAIRFN